MPRLTRRSFLALAAAGVASPALAALPSSGETDIVIVGAGAAGIAAARRILAAGGRVTVLEAGNRIGGRCFTETHTFGIPYDRGAHWIFSPHMNPVARLASRSGLDIYPAPPGQKIRIRRRYAREGEMEQLLAMSVRAYRALQDAARGKTDVACAQALPRELGDWRPTIDFTFGPYGCGVDLDHLSAQDFVRLAERSEDAFCRQGYGALIAKLGEGIPVALSTPATRIDSSRGLEVATPRGTIRARAVIVTVSVGVLASDAITFAPDLPKRLLDALSRLRSGSYERIALEMPGNPLGLQRDDVVLEKSENARTAAMLANVSDSALCYIDVAGRFGRDLAAQGEAAMVDFATGWLSQLYGAQVRKAVARSHATRWSRDPLFLGASSYAAVNGQPSRRILMEPVRDRVFFAGEAAHETWWGSVPGAWESGERAADAALKVLSAPAAPSRRQQRQPQPRQQPQRQPQRRPS